MPRVKRGVTAKARHKKVLTLAKGYRGRRNAVYRIDAKDKKIHHLAGTGEKGNAGDGGPATKAKLNGPKGIAYSEDGGAYIADTENHRIVRYVPKTGNLELVAGTGKKGSGADGDPRKVELSQPHGVSVQPKTGILFVTDSYNNRILKIVK